MSIKDKFKVNKDTWNQKASIHAKSDFYNNDEFKKGKTSLMSYELDALGNVEGKSLLHLQCHFGQDTLSWQRKGANCVGLDFSDEAIKIAKNLNDELNLDAEFVCCNVFDTRKHISKKFDIVFTSYGVIGWLPELETWSKVIADSLEKGGTFYMVEFHPLIWMFEYLSDNPSIVYPYSSDKEIYEEYKGTYADQNSTMISKEYGWNHSLSYVINSLLKAGLTLESFEEHYDSPYDILPNLVKNKHNYYELKDKLYPLLYSVKFTKN